MPVLPQNAGEWPTGQAVNSDVRNPVHLTSQEKESFDANGFLLQRGLVIPEKAGQTRFFLKRSKLYSSTYSFRIPRF